MITGLQPKTPQEQPTGTKSKLKAIFDSQATWSMIGAFTGTVLGAKAQAVVAGVGALVMSIL